jgi:hypothetical protein
MRSLQSVLWVIMMVSAIDSRSSIKDIVDTVALFLNLISITHQTIHFRYFNNFVFCNNYFASELPTEMFQINIEFYTGDSTEDCIDSCPCTPNPDQGLPKDDCPLIETTQPFVNMLPEKMTDCSQETQQLCGGSCAYKYETEIPEFTGRDFSCPVTQVTKGELHG